MESYTEVSKEQVVDEVTKLREALEDGGNQNVNAVDQRQLHPLQVNNMSRLMSSLP